MVALAGTVAGGALGEMVTGPIAQHRAAASASFSHLSANPDALNAQGEGAAPCLDCPDSYGVAARLRADRDQRMSDEFRELGAVDVDPPPWSSPDDDAYRYGGRFPDPAPRPAVAPAPEPEAAVTRSADAELGPSAPTPAADD